METKIDKDVEIKRLNALCVALENQRNQALNQAANHHSDALIAQDDLRRSDAELDRIKQDEGAEDIKPPKKKNSKADLAQTLKPH